MFEGGRAHPGHCGKHGGVLLPQLRSHRAHFGADGGKNMATEYGMDYLGTCR